jgi:hypothetical protein
MCPARTVSYETCFLLNLHSVVSHFALSDSYIRVGGSGGAALDVFGSRFLRSVSQNQGKLSENFFPFIFPQICWFNIHVLWFSSLKPRWLRNGNLRQLFSHSPTTPPLSQNSTVLGFAFSSSLPWGLAAFLMTVCVSLLGLALLYLSSSLWNLKTTAP